jgi:hypothetical protein
MSSFYRLSEEVAIIGRWFLAEIRDEDGKEVLNNNFCAATTYFGSKKLTVFQSTKGHGPDFSMTAFGVPIVNKAFADVVMSMAPTAIQLLPVEVDGAGDGFYILNIISEVACVDYEKTVVQRYTPDIDPPEMVGKIHSLYNITIHPDLASGYHIFRLEEWGAIIIISQELKDLFEQHRFTGMYIVPVFS